MLRIRVLRWLPQLACLGLAVEPGPTARYLVDVETRAKGRTLYRTLRPPV